MAVLMSATYRDALRAALLYLVLSVAWFQFSGYLLNRFFDSSPDLLRWQLINGYAWVAFSAGLIFIARARLFGCLGIQALSHSLEQLVTDTVAETVIDQLEMIEVDHQQRATALMDLRRGHGLPGTVG